MAIDRRISVLGRACPWPLIALAREVRDLKAGNTLQITGNDPLFEKSVLEFCRERGHEVLEATRDGSAVTIVIRV